MNELSLLIPSGSAPCTDAKSLRMLGIDLGTTNSAIADIRWDSNKPNDVTLRCLEVDQQTSAGIYTNTLMVINLLACISHELVLA